MFVLRFEPVAFYPSIGCGPRQKPLTTPALYLTNIISSILFTRFYFVTDTTDEIKFLRFLISPLKTGSYYFWSNDLEVLLKGKRLWIFVETPYSKCSAAPETIDEKSSRNESNAIEAII